MSVKQLLKDYNEKYQQDISEIEDRLKTLDQLREDFKAKSEKIFSEIVEPKLFRLIKDFSEASLAASMDRKYVSKTYGDAEIKAISAAGKLGYKTVAFQIDVVADSYAQEFKIFFYPKIGGLGPDAMRDERPAVLKPEEVTEDRIDQIITEQLDQMLKK